MGRRILLVACLLLAPALWACRCRPPPPPKASLATATAVFAGKVTALRKVALGPAGQEGVPYLEVTLAVSSSWKGARPAQLIVLTATDTAGCGYPFTEGQSYLIYADGPVIEGDARLSTHTCTRTRSLADAEEDLRDLGPGTKPD